MESHYTTFLGMRKIEPSDVAPVPAPVECVWLTGPWIRLGRCKRGKQVWTRIVYSSHADCVPTDPKPETRQTSTC